MKSPFPGMDPYLERHWPDVHTSVVASLRDALNQSLPPDLVARSEERIAIESDSDEIKMVAPDVRVLEAVERLVEPGQGGGIAIAAPYRLVALIEPRTERYIEIIDSSAKRLITVIEVLSPANKSGKGLEAFREKRRELFDENVHFVEIDLIREGDWRALLRPHQCRSQATSTYRATRRLISDPRAVYLYPILLRERLPQLPIPLRPGDSVVQIDLQLLVESAYRNGRYATTLNYAEPCEPPLKDEDANWADALLKAAGKR